jgi:hypothetical protein
MTKSKFITSHKVTGHRIFPYSDFAILSSFVIRALTFDGESVRKLIDICIMFTGLIEEVGTVAAVRAVDLAAQKRA